MKAISMMAMQSATFLARYHEYGQAEQLRDNASGVFEKHAVRISGNVTCLEVMWISLVQYPCSLKTGNGHILLFPNLQYSAIHFNRCNAKDAAGINNLNNAFHHEENPSKATF
jgi:hypothetical protein